MKYIKKFDTHTEYEEARQNLILPNVSLCKQENEVHYNPIVPPQPIAPVGKVQVFANPQCTEYANGYCKDVWVRLNQGFGYNDAYSWGNPQESGTRLTVATPTDEFPQDEYGVYPWIDWGNAEEINEPFTSGQIVKCSFYCGEPILDNVQVIFE